MLSLSPVGKAAVKGISWPWDTHDYSSGTGVQDMGVPSTYMAMPMLRVQCRFWQFSRSASVHIHMERHMNTPALGQGSERGVGRRRHW